MKRDLPTYMKEKIRDIGSLKGEILIFGGVYSNLQALESFKQVAEERKIPASNIICTGDIVGYCAQPEQCVQLVKDWGIHCIAGNVELNLRDEADDCGCNFDEGGRCDVFSRQWYPYAQKQVSIESLDWIASLPEFIEFNWNNKKVLVLHGSLFNTSEFVFKSTPWALKQANFDLVKAEMILAGHCGIPFAQHNNKLSWLNAGVIGMPANDGNTEVWYLRLSSEIEQGYVFETLKYDHQKANALMLEQPLPKSYAKTLLTGIWDNCEILPEEETTMQGMVLTL